MNHQHEKQWEIQQNMMEDLKNWFTIQFDKYMETRKTTSNIFKRSNYC